MHLWVPILLQAVLAVIVLRLVTRMVLPALLVDRDDGLLLDVWIPLLLIAPMLFGLSRVNGSVRSVGFMPLGGPIVLAFLALGLSLIVSARRASGTSLAPSPWALGSWTGSGLLLLLLAAAHAMFGWTGQLFFALAAVVLWINTPQEPPPAVDSRHDALRTRASIGLILVLAVSLVQGFIVLRIDPELRPVSDAVLLVAAAIVLAAVAAGSGDAGPALAVRISGWAATYGVLFGLGILSIGRLIPSAMHAVSGMPNATPLRAVAFGFGSFAPEAVALLAFAPLAFAVSRAGARLRSVIGGAVLLAAAMWAAWRIAAFS